MKKTDLIVFTALLTLHSVWTGPRLWAETVEAASEYSVSRLHQVVEANILAVHAYQIGLAKGVTKADPACFSTGTLSEATLRGLVEHQSHLLSSNPEAVKDWLRGKKSAFDPSRDLEPIVMSGLTIPEQAPVNVFSRYLNGKVRASEDQIRAIANLYQTILEVERDGDLLQAEFDFYLALGLPVYVGQLGLPGSDEDFLRSGRELAAQCCISPFDTDPAAWQIAGRKIWNWGEKKLHIRDEKVLAQELLAEPEIQRLIPNMRALPPQKIAVVGHSFTMGQHWSSPSSFVPIVTALFARVNDKIQFRQFQAGGLTASRAMKNFYVEVLAWKPDKVLMVVMARNEEDFESLKRMGEGFHKAGIQAYLFDNVHDPEATDAARIARFNQIAKSAGFSIIEVNALLSSAPDRGQFLCLDGIHMKEPYHRLMAKEWLKFLAGARTLQLEASR
jgi:hypothetical protein